jgi:hypothetical protein
MPGYALYKLGIVFSASDTPQNPSVNKQKQAFLQRNDHQKMKSPEMPASQIQRDQQR